MRNIIKKVILLVIFASLPIAAQAMDHGKKASDTMDHGKMDHGKMASETMDHGKMDHGGMDMQGDMIMLGNSVQDGVKAMAHLKDVRAAMAKMGMAHTHHIMVMFTDAASGEPIESGVAAVKIKGSDGKEGEALKLMGMQGHFGTDIELKEPGEYHFIVGTRLADGKKRQFEFEYTLK
jgi:uncharacterized protein involved in copper resistance